MNRSLAVFILAFFLLTAGGAYAQPTISSLSPSTVTAGSPTFLLTVTGSGYDTNSIVRWTSVSTGVVNLTTFYLSPTQLSATVPNSYITSTGTVNITVRNIDSSTSSAFPFTIQPAAATPTITSLGSSSALAGGNAFQLSVNGGNFVNGAIVQWYTGSGSQPLQTVYLSATQLTAVVPADLIATEGSAFVAVQNPGGTLSNLSTFTINPPLPPAAPTIASLNSTSVAVGSATFQLTVTGTNFVSNSVVQWNSGDGPQSLSTVFLSGTQLTALVPGSLVATLGSVFVSVQNPGGIGSNLAIFTVTPVPPPATPTINTLSPASVAAGAASFTIGVAGTNFVTGSIVRWNSGGGAVDLATVVVSATQLTAIIPPDLVTTAGTAFVTVQNPGNLLSSSATFTIGSAPAPSQPTVANISPDHVTAGSAATPIAITGTNFVSGSTVQWNSGTSPQTLPTVYVSPTQLTVLVPAGLIANVGTAFVNVVNPGPLASNLVSFTINAATAPPPPAIDSETLTPNTAVAGSGSFTIGITGTNFVSGSVVQWNAGSGSQSLATVFAGSTALTALVPASLITSAGTAFVSVQNPGGAVSNLVQFTITAAPAPGLPIIGGLSPSAATAGSGVQQVVVTGANFVSGSVVQWNAGSGVLSLTTTFVNANQLTATVPANLLTTAGSAFVTVQNPGPVNSSLATFNINPAATVPQPTINTNGLTPASATAGGGSFTLTVNGTNFASGSVVRWNSGTSTQALSTQVVSATQLTALVPASLITTSGPVFVTVQNSSGATSNIANFAISAVSSPTPTIDPAGVSPNNALAGSAAIQITVTGTNFTSSSVVQWNTGSTPQALFTAYQSATQLSAVVPASLLTTAGSVFISVQNPGGATSNLLGFTITAPAPVQPSITGALIPASTTAGGSAFQLLVNGSNFVSGSTVQWNLGSGPQTLPTVFVSASQLAAVVPANLIATAQTAFVSVLNPGGLTSNVVSFPINAAPAPAAPTIATNGLNPSSVTAGSPSFQLTVTGTNYVSGSVVQWNSGAGPQSLATVFLSGTQLTALVPASLIAAVGPVFVSVQNPGGIGSNLATFTVNAVQASPIISSGGLSPSSVEAGAATFTLGVSGANFVGASVVQWNNGSGSVALATVMVSSTQLTAIVPASLVAAAGTAFVTVQNPGNLTSNTASFTISAAPAPAQPTASGVTPNNVTAGSTAIPITVTGTNFVSASVVQWNTGASPQVLSTVYVSATQLTALVPTGLLANAGSAFVNVVNPGGLASNLVSFTVNPAAAPPTPSITSGGLTPATTVAGGPSFTIGITGTNFVSGSVVQWNTGSGAQSLATVFVGSTALTALVPASLISSAGTVFVSVQNPGGIVSNPVTFTVTAAPAPGQPTIGTLSPSSATAGSSVLQLIVTGTNFVGGSTVQWNSGAGAQSLTTTFVNANQLTAVLPASLLTTAGSAFVTVQNPGPVNSNLATFTINPGAAPQPTINTGGLAPSSATAGGASFSLTVNGSNFVSGSVVQWNAGVSTQALSTQFVSATQLTALVPASLIGTASPVFVTVQNPGGTTSNIANFTINALSTPTPTIDTNGLSPSSATAGSAAIQVVVTGTNFANGSIVQWSTGSTPQGLFTTYQSATQLSAVVPASLLTTAGSVFISVQNPGGATSNLLGFTITAPAPVQPSISSGGLSPASATAGSSAFQLLVSGSNFVSGSTVQWNLGSGPQTLSTVFVSATQLAAVVPANLIATAQTAFVSVVNPGGLSSNVVSFPINAAPAPAAPTIASNGLSPSSVTAGSPSFQLTVTGTNYVSGSVVQWNSGAGPQSLATVFLSGTQLTALVPASLIATVGPVFVSVQNPGGIGSNLATFTVNAVQASPTITSGGLSPSSVVAGAATFTLGVAGANFVTNSVVQWNNGSGAVALATVMVSSTQLTAIVPASLVTSAGTAFVTVQNPGNLTSNTASFTISAAPAPAQPTATSVTPNNVTAGSAAIPINVTGTNFVSTSVVQWNTGASPQALSTVYVSATQLTALVPTGLLANAGNAFVNVVNPGGLASNLVSFTVNPAAAPPTPSITSGGLTPATTVAGSPSFTIGITGTNFVSGSVVQWNAGSGAQSLATVFVGSTALTALVPASLITSAGTAFISVQNPGGIVSNLVTFTVTAAPAPGQPTIGTLSPSSATAGSSVLQLIVTGTNFVGGSTVQWNSGGGAQSLTTTYVNANQLTAVLPASLLTTAGTAFVTVQNPGSVNSNLATFTINPAAAPQPTINTGGLAPSSATAGGASFSLTVNGANFVSGSVVQWNAGVSTQALSTQFVSATQLTALVPSGLITAAGPVFVTVQNTGGATSNIANFTINAVSTPTPTIDSNGLAPSSATVGSAAMQIVVTGTNFASGSIVQWSTGSTPQGLFTTYQSATQLQAVVPASLLTTAGTVFISVQNSGGTTSNLVAFTINAPAPSQPAISSGGLNPSSTTAGGPAFQLLINGTNFVSGSVAQWNFGNGPQTLSTVFVSATQLAAVVPANLITSAGTAFIAVQNPGATLSNLVPLVINAAPAPAAPAIATNGLNPASVIAGTNAFQLTVSGSNFVSGSVVQWNSGAGPQTLATVFLSATQLTALVPASLVTAAGPVFVSVQNPGGVGSNLSTFTIAPVPAPTAPTIDSGGLSPSSVAAGGGSLTIGVTGTGFVSNSVVQWNSGSGAVALATVVVSSTQITAIVPANLVAAAGSAFVTVQNPGSLSSNTATFTISAAPAPAQPTVTGITPNTATAGSAATPIAVTGTNFVSGSTVQWNTGASPQNLSTIFVNSTQLTALIPTGLLANAGTAFVNVTNPGGTASNLVTFTISPAPAPPSPTISTSGGLTPATATAGSASFTLGVTGSNFVSGSIVQWNSGSGAQPLSTVYVGSTQLTALVPASFVSTAGTVFVSVQNPGGVTSNLATFTVTVGAPPGQPTIATSGGLTPSSVTAGIGLLQLVVTGTNFVNGSVVQWNAGSGPQALSTTFVNPNQLTGVIPAALLTNSGTVFVSVQNPGGSTSNLATFTINPAAAPPQPTINTGGLAPSSATAGGASFQLAVAGANFVNGSVVQWNAGTSSQALATQFISSGQLTALVPSSLITTAGAVFVTVQNPGGVTSNIATFSINAAPSPTPTIDTTNGLNPSTATVGSAAVQITVQGTNFVNGSQVQWTTGQTPQGLFTVYLSATQLSAVVPANLLTSAGTVFVSVQNPGGGGSNLVAFTISAPVTGAAPTIGTGGLSPSTTVAGGSAFQLTVTGTNFVSGSVVQWNTGSGAQSLATVLVSPTQLTALVPANLITQVGPVFVSVQNPGGVGSNLATFTVTAAPAPTPPTITAGGLSPSSIAAGGGSFQLGITGTNFVSGSVAQWNGGSGATGLATVVVSSTQLTALVPASLVANAGSAFITIQNPGSLTSNTATFTINAAPAPAQPTATTVAPSSATAGSASIQVSITGTNFVSGSAVQWNTGSSPQTLSSVFLNSTQLTALVPAALLANAGNAFLSVINPGGQSSNLLTFTINAAPPAPAPTINATGGLTPVTVVAGSPSITIGVTGTNFVSGSVVQWNAGSGAQSLATVFASSTQLTALVPASMLTSPGTVFVSVQNPGGVTSNLVTFAVTAAPAPGQATIATSGGLSPSSVTAGSGVLQMVITGSNFVSGSVVQWNGTSGTRQLTTVFVNSNQLAAIVPADLIVNAGTAFVSVQNPGASGSNLATFTINPQATAPPPTINANGLAPSSAALGSATLTMTITGTGFVSGSKVHWDAGSGDATLVSQFLSSTQLTALVPASDLAAAGTAFVTVENPDKSTSSPATFTITSVTVPQPAIDVTGGLSPSHVTAGSAAITLTVKGTNFVSGSIVQWNIGQNPQNLFTVFGSSTQLTAVVPAALLTTAGSFPVGVSSPGNVNSIPVVFAVDAAPTAPAPVITDPGGLSPSSVSAGGAAFTLNVSGSGFVSNSVVQWGAGGTPQTLSTSFVSSSLVRALVPANLIGGSGTVFVSVQNPSGSGGASNQVNFTINAPNAPSINTNGLSPSSATVGSSGFLLTVTGTNFVSGATVQWYSGSTPTPLSTSFLSSTQLTALVPANLLLTAGVAFVGVQNPSGVASSLSSFTISTVAGPTITSIDPSTAASGSSLVTMKVTGTNFVAGAIVLWNGGGTTATPLSTGFNSATQLTALVPASLLTSPGTVLVSVQNPDKSLSNASTFTITGQQITAAPTVSSVTPGSASAGSSSMLQVSVAGTNFVAATATAAGSVVQWNGSSISTIYVSSTQLTGLVDSGLLQTAGAAFVSVLNPGNLSSNGVKFQVNGPTLSAVTPATIAAGGPTFSISLTGSNFVSGSVAVWNGTNLTTTFGSPTQLTAQVPSTLIATAGSAFILVTSPGGAATTPLLFTVTVPVAPTLSSLTPSSAVAGGPAFQLSASGSGFVNGTVILWNGAPLATGYVNGSQVTALVDSSLTATAGSANITVQNPGSAASSALRFNIIGPTITSLSPSTANAGDPNTNLTVSGSNFVAGATVLWNGSPLPTSFVNGSSPQLVAIIDSTLLKTPTLVSITVQNPGGTVSAAQFFTVNSPTLRITTSSLPDAVVGTFYSQTLSATGGDPPYSWSLATGTLPDGFRLDSGGIITGTAAGPASAVLGITVTDGKGRSSTLVLGLRAALALSITTQTTLPLATAGSNYSTQLVGSGGTAPYLWSTPTTCKGDNTGDCMPVGLSVNIATGEITGIPTTPGAYHFAISCRDSRQQQNVSKAFDLAVSISTLTISGLSANSAPAQQLPLTVSTGIPYTVDMNGTLKLTFASSVGSDDPSVQFSTSGRTVNFTIPAGSTQASFGKDTNLLVATGTLAGTITIQAALKSAASDITPNPAPVLTSTVPKQIPVITSVNLTKVKGGVLVEISGFSTTREITQATLVFNAASGAELNSVPITVPLASTLSAWYQSTASAPFGSQFSVTIPAGVQGDLDAIGSVTVTIANASGTSAPVNGEPQ